MPINRPAVPTPEKVQLSEGVLVFNFNPDDWDDESAIPFGAVRGGGTYTIEPTRKPIRFDGDKGEYTKGLTRNTEFMISITANALEIDAAMMARIQPGDVTEVTGTTDPNYKEYRPRLRIKEEDYLDNLAYITETKDGKVVAYMIENVLGGESFAQSFEDKEELVPEVTFHAYFDPEKMDEVPARVIFFDAETL